MRRRTCMLFGFLPALLLWSFPDASAAPTNSLERGAWGLEFQVQPSLFSPSGTGAGIAAKHQFTDRSAVRFGFVAGISSSDISGTQQTDRFFPYETINATAIVSGYSDRRDVSVFMHLAHYVGVGSRIALVVEAGPVARWISEEYGNTDTYPPPYGIYSDASDRNSWNYGIEAQSGFEWFFRRRLSLAARYGVSAVRTESRETRRYDFYNPNDGYWDRRFDNLHSDGFAVQTTSAVISLIAYW